MFEEAVGITIKYFPLYVPIFVDDSSLTSNAKF